MFSNTTTATSKLGLSEPEKGDLIEYLKAL
jgi:hypothetical protein